MRAEEIDLLALSADVAAEIAAVLGRSKFARALSAERRQRFLDALRSTAIWFEPSVRIAECRDPKDNMYLELALAAGAGIIVSSDSDLQILNPWRGVQILGPAAYLAST
ncbi:putative toxin-antitoxin system toxin component, PIN family [Enhydrobacter sp.]|jgi:putative PIN family toxin of toxin-antitoxin system|uniref:putative toxin-antitoxin system toxin component, PIN family n=1 Tax=Enhydrobacter sp. TaxID=1894999 RepID=UPI0026156BAC|nr:putative toxin-antitoxin system toxin component, PIN family [Enhydrobacter sp.]WIM09137.1 MAG: hypothetical protein OJF58_000088 [Enhydrobacter sp.]